MSAAHPGAAVQIQFDFDPSIRVRYDTLQAVTVDAYGSSRIKKRDIASACDMSPSELSRQVYRNDGLKLGLDEFERLLDNMPDTRGMVLDYLIGKYRDDPADIEARALRTVAELDPAVFDALAVLARRAGR